MSSAVAMINSAHTYVDLESSADGSDTSSNWVMESGALEFFVFASALDNGSFNKFKKV